MTINQFGATQCNTVISYSYHPLCFGDDVELPYKYCMKMVMRCTCIKSFAWITTQIVAFFVDWCLFVHVM